VCHHVRYHLFDLFGDLVETSAKGH
jgi:hypothetical protein